MLCCEHLGELSRGLLRLTFVFTLIRAHTSARERTVVYDVAKQAHQLQQGLGALAAREDLSQLEQITQTDRARIEKVAHGGTWKRHRWNERQSVHETKTK